MKNTEFKNEIVSLVKTADIGIEDIALEEEIVPDSILESMPISESLKNEIVIDVIEYCSDIRDYDISILIARRK